MTRYYKEEKIKIKELEAVECDSCHKIIKGYDVDEVMYMKYKPGYFNKSFNDGSVFCIELCPECLDALLGEYMREEEL